MLTATIDKLKLIGHSFPSRNASCYRLRMKQLQRLLLFLICLFALTYSTNPGSASSQRSTGVGASFKGPVGLQLYSLRDQFAKNVPETLDQVRDFGIKYVELAGTYKL